VIVAERSRQVLGQSVAVALSVGRPHERSHDLEVPLRDVARLAPEVGEPEVDVELQEIDAGWSLGHEASVGGASDDAAHAESSPPEHLSEVPPERGPGILGPRSDRSYFVILSK
jgi:hypothetical protein